MSTSPFIGPGNPPTQSPIVTDKGFPSIAMAGWMTSIMQRIGVQAGNTGAKPGNFQQGVIANPTIQDTAANQGKYLAKQYLGMFYLSTDVGLLYISELVAGVPTWIVIAGVGYGLMSAMPSTLTAASKGFEYETSDYKHRHRWNSEAVTAAVWAAGSATITTTVQAYIGQSIIVENVVPSGYNGTFVVTANAAGTLTYVVANPGAYVSGGTASAWWFAPGDDGSGWMAPFYAGWLPRRGGLWALSDGSAVNIAQPDGQVLSVTSIDLVSAARLIGGDPTGSGFVAASVPTWQAGQKTDTEATHTHAVAITSQAETADASWDLVAGGVTIPAAPHAHAVTGNTGAGTAHQHNLSNTNAKLNAPSDANGGMPAHVYLLWFIRR